MHGGGRQGRRRRRRGTLHAAEARREFPDLRGRVLPERSGYHLRGSRPGRLPRGSARQVLTRPLQRHGGVSGHPARVRPVDEILARPKALGGQQHLCPARPLAGQDHLPRPPLQPRRAGVHGLWFRVGRHPRRRRRRRLGLLGALPWHLAGRPPPNRAASRGGLSELARPRLLGDHGVPRLLAQRQRGHHHGAGGVRQASLRRQDARRRRRFRRRALSGGSGLLQLHALLPWPRHRQVHRSVWPRAQADRRATLQLLRQGHRGVGRRRAPRRCGGQYAAHPRGARPRASARGSTPWRLRRTSASPAASA